MKNIRGKSPKQDTKNVLSNLFLGNAAEYIILKEWLEIHNLELAYKLEITDWKAGFFFVGKFMISDDVWLAENCELPFIQRYISSLYGV